MPTMMMGSAPVFIDCDEVWKLLLITKRGSLYVWDLLNKKCLLQDSLVSLITTDLKANGKDTGKPRNLVVSYKAASQLHDLINYINPIVDLNILFSLLSSGTIKVISAKLSKCGSPLVVLATRHAYLFDVNLKCWLRVADDCFPASNFATSWTLGSALGGELAALQVDVRKFLARKPGWSRYVCLLNLGFV